MKRFAILKIVGMDRTVAYADTVDEAREIAKTFGDDCFGIVDHKTGKEVSIRPKVRKETR